MPQNWTARLPAWTGDLSTMQQVLAATLVALVLMLVLYGLQRRRQQGLGLRHRRLLLLDRPPAGTTVGSPLSFPHLFYITP